LRTQALAANKELGNDRAEFDPRVHQISARWRYGFVYKGSKMLPAIEPCVVALPPEHRNVEEGIGQNADGNCQCSVVTEYRIVAYHLLQFRSGNARCE